MRITIVLLCFMSFGLIKAQDDIDSRLLSHFTPEELSVLASENPQTLEYWSFYLDKGYLIKENANQEPTKDFIALDIPDEINLLALNIFPKEEAQFFYDSDRKRLLSVSPSALITKKFNARNSNK